MLFSFVLSKDEVVLFVLLLSCVLFAIISTLLYFCMCIVASNVWVDEDAETINLEQRTAEHQVSHSQAIQN